MDELAADPELVLGRLDLGVEEGEVAAAQWNDRRFLHCIFIREQLVGKFRSQNDTSHFYFFPLPSPN